MMGSRFSIFCQLLPLLFQLFITITKMSTNSCYTTVQPVNLLQGYLTRFTVLSPLKSSRDTATLKGKLRSVYVPFPHFPYIPILRWSLLAASSWKCFHSFSILGSGKLMPYTRWSDSASLLPSQYEAEFLVTCGCKKRMPC